MLVPPIQVMNDHVGKPFKTGDLGIPRNFRNLWWNSSIFAKFLGRTGRLDGGGEWWEDLPGAASLVPGAIIKFTYGF